MKLSALTIAAAALTMACGGSALAQAAAPVTMQPIANPPEKPAMSHMGKHHGKHHRRNHAHHAKADKSAGAKSDASTPPAK